MSTKTARLRGAKVVSALLALAMALALTPAAPRAAWGDDESGSTSGYTISVASGSSRTFNVYQIATGTFTAKTTTTTSEGSADDTEASGVLTNVKWGQNVNSAKGSVGSAVSSDDLTVLKGLDLTTDAGIATLKTYVDMNTAYGSVSTEKPLANVPSGYYLIQDVTPSLDEAYSLYIVKVLGANLKISPKTTNNVYVDSSILVQENSTSSWGAAADYAIGASIPFSLTAKISGADISGADVLGEYDTYYMKFTNKIDAGLTAPSSIADVKVYYKASDDASETEIVSGYTANIGNEELTVEFQDLKNAVTNLSVGGSIVVKYNATLNNNAVLGGSGNSSELQVGYSNNPNDSAVQGKTNTDTAKVYTYELQVNSYKAKTDGSDPEELTSSYKLYKADATGGFVDAAEITASSSVNPHTWTGLDSGTYKLVEDEQSNGFNKVDDITFTITSTYDSTGLTALGASTTDSETTFSGVASTGVVTTDIYHTAGALFPVSGGVGTTIFYLVGGCMIVAACVALTAYRKRRLARVIAGK
jgi:fimbrial isopeptide formation D2 family protein